jgi:ubiquitin-conjugating enzyme E2 J2
MPQSECPAALTRILMAQLGRLSASPAPFFIATPNPADMRVVYFLIGGLGDPYAGGEYVFQLIAPDEFPQKPPRLIFLTPNGLFTPGHKVCISVGEFHANDRPGKDGAHGWRPALGLRGFALEVVNALICSADLGHGIGIDHQPPKEKRKLARVSRAFNQEYLAEITAAFEAQIAENSSEPVTNILAARAVAAADIPAAAMPAPAAAAAAAATPAPATVTPAAAAATPAPAAAAPLADAELDAIINGLF